MHASPTKNGAPGVRREIVIDFSNDRSSNTETVREVVGDLVGLIRIVRRQFDDPQEEYVYRLHYSSLLRWFGSPERFL
jgi:hypothetical protein